MVTNLGISQMKLGNGMFQIATVIGYSKKHNIEYKLPEWRYNNIFNINENNILKETISLPTFNEQGFHYTEIPFIPVNFSMNGYFQSEKYFINAQDEIKNIFQIKSKTNFPTNENLCSIHVRRGDYLNYPNHHPVLEMNYYEKAIEMILEKNSKSVFVVMSDDLKWCKENFDFLRKKGIEIYFMEHTKDYDDLYIMTKCKNNIIANSSFSWWGAWLNSNKDKTIISPKNWFGSAYSHYNINDLYPNNFIKI